MTATLTRIDTEEQALLRAVLVQPGDDLPRLVYADWLEENGDGQRALGVVVRVCHPSSRDVRQSVADGVIPKYSEIFRTTPIDRFCTTGNIPAYPTRNPRVEPTETTNMNGLKLNTVAWNLRTELFELVSKFKDLSQAAHRAGDFEGASQADGVACELAGIHSNLPGLYTDATCDHPEHDTIITNA